MLTQLPRAVVRLPDEIEARARPRTAHGVDALDPELLLMNVRFGVLSLVLACLGHPMAGVVCVVIHWNTHVRGAFSESTPLTVTKGDVR